MKRAITILVGGLLVACAAYCLLYLAGTAAHRRLFAGQTPELLWLKKEFNLSEAEFVRIEQLHQAYLPQCQERCRRIEEINDKIIKTVRTATKLTPDIERLLAERARMRADCQAEMLKHFFEVSRSMPPEQGRRYLTWVQEQTCLREAPMDHGQAADASRHP